MRIRMKTTTTQYVFGEVVEIHAPTARAWIREGLAELHDGTVGAIVRNEPVEMATAEPPSEAAVSRRGKRR